MSKLKPSVKNAICIGTLCSVSYLAVYFARNILGAVTPQMVNGGAFTTEYIGEISSLFFMFYAFGQLINGAIGDKIKARYMISFGLLLAGISNLVFSQVADQPLVARLAYGMTGFFLAMIYGPMTKVVAENTEPIYATRCSLGYTFASFFGSPLAGVTAALLTWQSVFAASSLALFVMAACVFGFFLFFERRGIVKYGQYKPEKGRSLVGSVKILVKHRIIKFSCISIITGVIRTTVVFWLTTYISQYLNFPEDQAALLYTVVTLVISASAFLAVSVYEVLRRNMDLTILLMFSVATVAFLCAYFFRTPVLNLIVIVIAIIGNNCAASMLWSRYCPSLRDTGVVSGATGFLDFLSYMAAAASSTIFANAVSSIGWGNLILVWAGLMALGVLLMLPYSKMKRKHTPIQETEA